MSAPLLASLCKPLTPDSVRATIYMLLSKVGINTTAWQPGAPMRTLIAVVATMFSAYTYWASKSVQGMHLLLATGDWLTACAALDYGTQRNTASFASGEVTLTNTGAGIYDYDPGDLSIKLTKTEADGSVKSYYYSNVDAISVDPHQTQIINIIAEQSGSAPNFVPINPPDVTSFTVVGGSNYQILGNTAILGTDTETDQALQNRAGLAASAISPNGPGDAYRYVATSTLDANGAPLASKATVYASPGNVRLFVATSTGSALNPSQLSIIETAIRTNVVPLGVTFHIESCTAIKLVIYYTVYVNKNTTYTNDAISSAIFSALSTWISDFPIGGYPAVNDNNHTSAHGWLYLDQITSAIEGALDLPGIANPIFHIVPSVTVIGGSNPGDYYEDIPLRVSDILSIQNIVPTVYRQ